jgi:hypothetical protein
MLRHTYFSLLVRSKVWLSYFCICTYEPALLEVKIFQVRSMQLHNTIFSDIGHFLAENCKVMISCSQVALF